jgi:formylglycine-generating enzyme required for sulfatase activity
MKNQLPALFATFLIAATAPVAYAAPPVVSNVSASQRTGTELVDIYYDVSDPDSSTVTVALVGSYNNGSSWSMPMVTLSGANAFGNGVTPGTGKHVVWDAGNDFDGQYSTQCRIRVIASDLDPEGFVLIPASSFTIGDPFTDGGSNEKPQHSVSVSAFEIEKTEVDGTRWLAVKQHGINNGYVFDTSGSYKAYSHPVHSVTWYNAVKWCNARSEMDGRTPCYYTDTNQTVIYKTGSSNTLYVKWNANGYRLPTEVEWEKSSRGGLVNQRFGWGMTVTHNQANYSAQPGNPAYDTSLTGGGHPTYAFDPQPWTSPVGSFPPNGYNLFDMSGNVWEWCWDWYDANWYTNAAASNNDTRGPTGPLGDRVLRGGNHNSSASGVRCAGRSNASPGNGSSYFCGFRCVRGL